MIFEIISGGEKLTGWGKNGPAYFFPGERMGRPIFSPGKKLTGGKFRPVTPASENKQQHKSSDFLCLLKLGVGTLNVCGKKLKE